MPHSEADRSRYHAERDRLIQELATLRAEGHPEERQFEDGYALRDTDAGAMQGLRLRIRELTGLIEQIETGNA